MGTTVSSSGGHGSDEERDQAREDGGGEHPHTERRREQGRGARGNRGARDRAQRHPQSQEPRVEEQQPTAQPPPCGRRLFPRTGRRGAGGNTTTFVPRDARCGIRSGGDAPVDRLVVEVSCGSRDEFLGRDGERQPFRIPRVRLVRVGRWRVARHLGHQLIQREKAKGPRVDLASRSRTPELSEIRGELGRGRQRDDLRTRPLHHAVPAVAEVIERLGEAQQRGGVRHRMAGRQSPPKRPHDPCRHVDPVWHRELILAALEVVRRMCLTEAVAVEIEVVDHLVEMSIEVHGLAVREVRPETLGRVADTVTTAEEVGAQRPEQLDRSVDIAEERDDERQQHDARDGLEHGDEIHPPMGGRDVLGPDRGELPDAEIQRPHEVRVRPRGDLEGAEADPAEVDQGEPQHDPGDPDEDRREDQNSGDLTQQQGAPPSRCAAGERADDHPLEPYETVDEDPRLVVVQHREECVEQRDQEDCRAEHDPRDVHAAHSSGVGRSGRSSGDKPPIRDSPFTPQG